MNVILLGAPGAGKGTQAEIISEKLGIPTISTGNILREAVKNGTEVGLQAKAYMDAGKLVPDEVIVGIVKERVAQPDCQKGFILDGMPRTIPQAEALVAQDVRIDKVVSIEIADQVIEDKVEGVCDSCGGELAIRKDEAPETVKNRLKVFHDETEPLKAFYEKMGILKEIQGNQPIEGATKDILAALGADV